MPAIDDDDVVQVPVFAQITAAVDIMMTFNVVVNGQLDQSRLKTGLEELVQLGEWRKLGARLKRSKLDGFELHVPKFFSPARPAFQWHEHNEQIFAVDAGVFLPRSTSVSFHPTYDNSIGKYRPASFPKTVAELVDTPSREDESMLSASAVVFRDATLLTLCLPHVFTDAIGMKNVFAAWAAVVAGRKDAVPPVVDFRDDPLKDLDGEFDPSVRGARVRGASFLPYLLFYLKYIPDLIFNKEETRIIFIPQATVDRLKQDATETLKQQKTEGDGYWVSTANVVAAIFMKISTLFEPDSGMYTLGFPVNARGRAPALRSRAAQDGYLGVGVINHATAPIPTSEVRKDSVARLAIAHRAAIRQLDSPSELGATVGTLRRVFKNKQMVQHNTISGRTSYINDWSAAAFTDLDFSSALVEGTASIANCGAGGVVFMAGAAAAAGSPRRYWGIVFAKDGPAVPEAVRGVWIETAFSVYKWPRVEAYLASL